MEDTEDHPITFEDLGLKRPEATTDTILGKSRTWSSLKKKEIAFLALSIVALVGTIGLTFVKFAQYFECKDNNTKDTSNDNRSIKYICEDVDGKHLGTDFTFTIVIILNAGFCILYVVHGVLRERPYELGIFLTGSIIILVYAVINLATSDHLTALKWVRLGVLGSSAVVFIPVGFWLARQYDLSGNLIFRTIGSNSQLQRACKMFYAAFALLKLDAQLALSLVILILRDVQSNSTWDYVTLGVGGFFSLLWLSAGFLCLRMESKPLTLCVLCLVPVEPAYVIYRMYLAGMKLDGSGDDEHLLIPVVTLSAGVVALAVRTALAVVLVLCYRSFGLGLKEKMNRRRVPLTLEVASE